MDLNELMKQVVEDGLRWFPEVDKNVSHTALGMVEEAGECAGLVKKYERYTLNWEGLQRKLPEEIVDTIVYALKLAAQIGADIEEEYHRKRAVNEERFGHHPYEIRTPGRNGE
jgi:NTP pyrophosphatase (non-canonical NTP hydrolase)